MNKHNNILIYTSPNGKISVDVLLKEKTVWLSQSQLCELFGKAKGTISEHIKNIFEEEELDQNSVVRNFRTTASDGKNYSTNYYNLDLILAVGYRVKSSQGTRFRQWATERLKEYLIQGFSLNEEKIKTGKSTEYFDKLQARLREIRLSERIFYQKIKDIYTTSIDYDPKDDRTIEFFKIVQNKLLWAISKQTAAELVHKRSDHTLPYLGMKSFDGKDEKAITKKDVSIAKNYLNEKEIKTLSLLVEQYLAFAETMAEAQMPMKMTDWIERLDIILRMSGKEILTHSGKISHEIAIVKSEKEYDGFKEEQRKIEREDSIKELEADIKSLGKKNNSMI
ncbi:cell filamentation protein Fic [candidate division WOR-1 bacterium RIFOXYC2_FULL_37_10]|uniref:Cell filamentation protein Fic n=1 Tax=candidate division WOR-1 bacterium RIFOXYB2_FULL_37_13 TaxID=1802579 RepID=A0A1F4SLX3_UNCSA|nr:MAG: cell filamentation protein Fic [candidate division WOR-1 bacterium RIFOXYB2_FULL_37_13]OGC33465.1 MAG: cell filamentation protein Fic [candidate division WOR-1 bacterium RIFOXYC2_FULL_37_10]